MIFRQFVRHALWILSFTVAAQVIPASAQDQFLTGGDLSELPYYEKQGVKYYEGGQPKDLIQLIKDNGWKIIRVRLWVDPDPESQSVVSSLDNVTALGKRIKTAGLQFLLDIHYSDTWADPGHQKKPAAWADLPFPELVAKTREYSRDVITHLRENGAMPDLVQIGNETKNGLLYGSGINGSNSQPGGDFWENDKNGTDRAVQLLAAGLEGVRSGAAPAKAPWAMIHVPDGQDTGFIKGYFARLNSRAQALGVALNFDLIGLSYYPGDPWDAKAGYDAWKLSHLVDSMNTIATTLHKPVLVVETNYPHAGQRRPILGTPEFEFSPQGQAQFYQALMAAVKAVPDGMGKGVVVWEPDHLDWNSCFDAQGNALPAVRTLGGN